jgi:hypothetical protein
MAVLDEFFAGLVGFEWDEGNGEKNWPRHAVRQVEAEQALLNRPVLVALDLPPSRRELRFLALGQTDAQRRLLLVFTIRAGRVRVVSVRPMNPKEQRRYEQAQASEADS